MEPKRLFDLLYFQLENHPLEKSFGYKVDGSWKYFSTQEMIDMSRKTAQGLIELGLQAGDKVAIVSYKNRPEWTIVDIGCQMAGIISVPLYPTISSTEYQYILNDSGVAYAFVGSGDLYDKVAEAQEELPTFKGIFTFDLQEDKPYWQNMWSDQHDAELTYRMGQIETDDLVTLIYTSGTTGKPKGVMLTHGNILHVVIASLDVLPDISGKTILSFLPLCHIFEREAVYTYIYVSGSVHYTGTDNLGGDEGDLKAVKPYFFTAVPRLLEKVYEAIYNKGLALKGIKKWLFFWALSLTEDYEYDKAYTGWAAFKRNLADKLIFSKWREALGGNVIGIVSGSAPLQENVARIFSAAGIPIREGYGLTEASPVLTGNTFKKGEALLGSVGPTINGVTLMIDDNEGTFPEGEGEILAKGPNIMLGYYNKPDETMQVFKTVDGETWLKTGDVGKLIDGPGGKKYLKITDRKKELLKTSGGKYVAPAPIENRFKEDFFIEQIMVVGDKRRFVSALIVPSEDSLRGWCEQKGIAWSGLSEMVQHPDVLQLYQQIIDKYNPEFNHVEQIKKFTLIGSIWEAEKTNNAEAELTPTLKLKRRVIVDKYHDAIEEMYAA